MSRLTRREVRWWLDPIRKAFADIKAGPVDSIRGYAVTRLGADDAYARVDWCIAGFRGLIARLLPDIDCAPLAKIEKKLANGVPMTEVEINAALSLLNQCEPLLMRIDRECIKDAVLTEQVAIEVERMKDAA